MPISSRKSPSGRKSSRTPIFSRWTSRHFFLPGIRLDHWQRRRRHQAEFVCLYKGLGRPPGMNGAKKLYVKSFGCQMNVYDSQRMADTLAPEGYVETASADDADLVILNTCHIREKAAEKVYSELGRVRRMKDAAAAAGRRVTVAVAGCVAQAEGEEIIRRAPAVDLVVGPQSYHRLPGLLARAARDGKAIDTEFPADDKFTHLPAPDPRPEPLAAAAAYPPSSPCKKAATSSALFASCLTRAAWRRRGRPTKS